MKKAKYYSGLLVILLFTFLLCYQYTYAQRLNHGASQRMGGAGGTQRSFGGGGNSRSINGGSVKSPDRSIRTSPSSSGGIKAPDRSIHTNQSSNNLSGATKKTNINNQNIGNRTTNNIGNKTNINSGNTNISGNTININVVNNRNTVVRRNNINTYVRPPYVWGGRRYYCYHPYFYHPYHPFYWGPVWHPWGFFIAALATTAIIVSVENAEKEKEQYYFDQGVWYAQSQGGYTVVQAPVGGTVTTIPSNAQTVVVNNTTNYYYGGAYYEKSGTQYKVVPPPAGAVVDNLPEGGEEVKIGDQTYVKVGETYYQPVQVDGKDKYEVAQVEQGEK